MIYSHIAESLARLEGPRTLSLTEQALEQGRDPAGIILEGLCRGMNQVGELYARRQYFVPDMLKASAIFNQALERLEPLLPSEQEAPFARGAIGVVKGNTQDNGKNIVCIMLRANGVAVEDLGKSVPPERFLEAARRGVEFLGLSIMTSAGVNQARGLMEELAKQGLRERVKVMVGGAAVDESKARDLVGADGYAPDAAAALELVRRWFGS